MRANARELLRDEAMEDVYGGVGERRGGED